ncbi:hypothetical protein [Winogradskyella sp. PE311]|uniref:hypothetical protein n=1 Tax=Winogradskyella sp. PE311 TaxID=3366943 RepID=UPI00397FAE60
MKKVKLIFSLILLISANSLSAQGNYGIVLPTTANKNEINKNCQNCRSTFKLKVKEVQFSIKRDKQNLFFHTNDKKWFNQLFKNSNDGIAIDVVSKTIYDCTLEDVDSEQIRGTLLRPVYASRLKSGLKPFGKNMFRVLVGRIPDNLKNEDLEYNMLFLGNKSLCRYQVIFDLQAYKWDLLDMGMYLDSLSLTNEKLIKEDDDKFEIKYKTLRFKIPFEKNKSQYSPEDIKPLYDSLRLTNFNIKTININAYSSVEGSLERNIELQEERANSIAEAIQTYQKPTIKTSITSSENWVEFLNDIEGTDYMNLKSLSKSEIKLKLVGAFSKEMETYLKHHRKAVITLELERKDIYKNKSENELIGLFNQSISSGALDKASQIQNSIFDKLKNREVSPDILTKMEIPNQLKYLNFLNSNSSIKYQLDEKQIIIVRNELEALKKLDPKNPKIRYNLAALKFRIWRYDFEPVNDAKFKTEVYNLKNYGIDQTLIDRMMINYHIIKSEKYMRKRDYANKDKSVNYINKFYKKITLSDFDYFSLAQFLAYYANIEKAAELLTVKAKRIDVDEDLLFYYLNLTLVNKELTQTDDYRAIMLNAYNLNSKRYCKLFNAIEKGGVTFQLLENDYLRKGYCESCN